MFSKAVFVFLLSSSILIEYGDCQADTERFVDKTYSLRKTSSSQLNPFANKDVPSDFGTITSLLAQERSNSKLYNTIWGKAEAQYAKKKQDHPDFFKSSTREECYIAVIAYTLGTPVKVDGKNLRLYQEFNRAFRELTDEASWDRFPYKSFYYLITEAIPGIKNDPNPSQDLFRGINGLHMDPQNVGDTFYFDSFASCSTDRSKAENFMKDDGTLIKIEGGATVAIGIDKYSPLDEKEVLVFPRNKFRVKKFERKGTKDYLFIEKAN